MTDPTGTDPTDLSESATPTHRPTHGIRHRLADSWATYRLNRADRKHRKATDRATPTAPVAPTPTPHLPTTTPSAPTHLPTRQTLTDRLTARLILAAPLVVAGWFQAHAVRDLLQTNWLIAVGFTLCWEGAAYYVATLYGRALLRGDSTLSHRAGMLTYAAGSCALLAAELHNQNQAMWLAGAVGVLTLSSIYLWAKKVRDLHRDQLHARGLVDAQATKFSALRWVLCPIETPKAFRFGIKYSLSRLGPDHVLTHYRAWRSVGRPKTWPPVDVTPPTTVLPTAVAARPTATVSAAPTKPQPRPRTEPAALPTATPVTQPALPIPTAQATPTRPATTRNIRSADRPADDWVIAELHARYSDHPEYPTKRPTQAEIQSVAGGSPDRAIRLRKAFIADHNTRMTTPTDQENTA